MDQVSDSMPHRDVETAIVEDSLLLTLRTLLSQHRLVFFYLAVLCHKEPDHEPDQDQDHFWVSHARDILMELELIDDRDQPHSAVRERMLTGTEVVEDGFTIKLNPGVFPVEPGKYGPDTDPKTL